MAIRLPETERQLLRQAQRAGRGNAGYVESIKKCGAVGINGHRQGFRRQAGVINLVPAIAPHFLMLSLKPSRDDGENEH